MEIKINNPKEILGNAIYIGHDPKHGYDREKKMKTNEIVGSTIEIASDKLRKSINIRPIVSSHEREIHSYLWYAVST